MALAGGQHGRHDYRAGMHGPAFESVVEIFAMRRGAVYEGCAGCTESARMADGRAWPFIVAAGERALDVVLVARRDTKTNDVDQQFLAFPAHRRRQIFSAQHGDGSSELLGNGCFGQSSAHKTTFRHVVVASRRAPPNFRLLASATMAKVITSMSNPSTAMAAR